jgi:formylglycine-generating enzyme required for sulfatase activity
MGKNQGNFLDDRRIMEDRKIMDDESPAHEVELGAFAIGKYPVTIGEYMRFVEATRGHYPEWLKERVDYNDEISTAERYRSIGVNLENKNSPIVGISWKDAGAYCAWLSERTGEQYELPTEAEWEYACRAGKIPSDRCQILAA